MTKYKEPNKRKSRALKKPSIITYKYGKKEVSEAPKKEAPKPVIKK